MLRRLALMLAVPALLAPGAAHAADTPEEAIAAVKRVLKRTAPGCDTEWAKIRVVGYPDDWQVTVVVRESEAGDGPARWRVGEGPPRALNELARTIARGCGS